jgi:hypothetical protein
MQVNRDQILNADKAGTKRGPEAQPEGSRAVQRGNRAEPPDSKTKDSEPRQGRQNRQDRAPNIIANRFDIHTEVRIPLSPPTLNSNALREVEPSEIVV